jgi:8-oxo-dGTP pyrophosphatase MutT (NUDIX family)
LATTPIPKVLAYITRDGSAGKEVLVFRHRHHPDAGIQVPGGTVEPGEDLIAALHREVEEETGLTGLQVVGQLAQARFFAAWRDEWQERNVFHLEAPSELASSWLHVVTAGEEDKGLHLDCFWLPVNEAQAVLRWGQGEWLEMTDRREVSSRRQSGGEESA